MSASPLALVPAKPLPERPETVAEHVRRLQAEARALSADHIAAFAGQIEALVEAAREIEAGGDAYPAGARQLARTVADDLTNRAQTLAAITGRG